MPPKKRKLKNHPKSSKPKSRKSSFRRKRSHKKGKTPQLSISPKVLSSIGAIVFFLLTILTFLSFFASGQTLDAIQRIIESLFSWGKIFIPFIFFFAGTLILNPQTKLGRPTIFLGLIILLISLTSITRSGQLGDTAWESLSILISGIGAFIVLFAGVLIGFMVLFEFSLKDLFGLVVIKKPETKPADLGIESKVKNLDPEENEKNIQPSKKSLLSNIFKKPQVKTELKINNLQEETNSPVNPVQVNWDEEPLIKSPNELAKKSPNSPLEITDPSQIPIWNPPPLSLLSVTKKNKPAIGDIKNNADTIEKTLQSFGIQAKIEEVSPGPTVTQYAIKPDIGTKLSKITSLSNDLAMALAAKTGQIRIEAPIPGKPLVGIEVPNLNSSIVTLRQMLKNPRMTSEKSKLLVGLGLDVAGQQEFLDIAKMPHLLIAGQTGSGKSVCINVILCSILYRTAPHEVKLILVDPKRVELSIYNGIPHLLTPVIVEPEKVLSSLKWAVAEMDRRYKILAESGCRNIAAYNEMMGIISMPYILIVIDELADIMLFAPSEVEDCINRLAQMARAVGVHLVLATQRPSVDIITGLIKANIPARVAFSVSSMMDSRVILDTPGAEKLLGKGDMLFIPPDQAKPRRLQGAFVSDEEVKNITDYIRNNGIGTQYSEEVTQKYQNTETKGGKPVENSGLGDVDELFAESLRIVYQHGKASSSLLQRALSIGYNRAARILDQLYETGAISAPNGSKPRDVLTSSPESFLAELSRKNQT